MDLFQLLVLFSAVPVGFTFICRLALLDVWTHRPAVVVMHVAMATSVAWAGYHAFNFAADVGDFAAVLGSACWIAISYTTWRHEVPEHFCSRPTDLDPSQYRQVHGGKK